jgi:RNA polymerase sigma-70 factor (ECF subfamily)
MEVNPHLTEKAQRDCLLVKAALERGDQSAYAELMNKYRDTLYFMMLKMTNNPQDADDMTIEAFGKAFRNLKQYTPEYAFSTWLFKIATNNCIDFIRKNRNTNYMKFSSSGEQEGTDGFQETITDEMPDPEEAFIRSQKAATLREIVEKLKPHYRLLIQMRYFDEKSYDEIATELELPLGTVKAQLFRAREFLFNIMKNIREKI